jgi:ubiquinone/menaquinone biosynthesis C-methylase UbiE
MLPRTLEPEVMDTSEEASDYDAMDHTGVNTAFADDFAARFPGAQRVLDMGTGTARIPILLAARLPRASMVGIDLADTMLAVGRENVQKAGLEDRIVLEARDCKATGLSDGSFDAVVSNSVIHHIPEPGAALGEMWRLLAPGGILFIRDLKRPVDVAEVEKLTGLYAAIPPGLAGEALARETRQQGYFVSSLHAALTVDEVKALLLAAGIHGSEVYVSSDRHWTLVATKRS